MKVFDPNLCNRCGKCCHSGLVVNGTKVMLHSIACVHLRQDGVKTKCAVYEERFSVAPWCLTVAQAYESRELPKDCPYVESDPHYAARFEEADLDAERTAIEIGSITTEQFDYPTRMIPA